MSGRIVAIALLAAVYALTLRSAAPADLATGALLGTVLTLALPLTRRTTASTPPRFARRLAAFPAFALAVLADVARGTFDVALRVAGLRPADRGGMVEVPIGARSELGVAVSALTATLSPGTLLVDVDRDREVLVFHVIDASDPDGFVRTQQDFYDRHQRSVFP